MAENNTKRNVAKNKQSEIVIMRIFDAPRELVWKAWTEPERMKRWWGPKVFTAPVIKINFRIGGQVPILHAIDGGSGFLEHWYLSRNSKT